MYSKAMIKYPTKCIATLPCEKFVLKNGFRAKWSGRYLAKLAAKIEWPLCCVHGVLSHIVLSVLLRLLFASVYWLIYLFGWSGITIQIFKILERRISFSHFQINTLWNLVSQVTTNTMCVCQILCDFSDCQQLACVCALCAVFSDCHKVFHWLRQVTADHHWRLWTCTAQCVR